ncbi:MAG TPA: protein kinase [Gemmatimonadaceae bacterium]|nr:protein kinase [Gemmatimonadaceae bacterium]
MSFDRFRRYHLRLLVFPMDAIIQLNSALAGRYELEREIGAGGMATVYLARDLRHDRLVALKVLDPELGSQLGPERFLGEIRVTANLQHPNILPLFDSGEARDPNGTDGSRFLFYVMPYVAGESLRARLARERQLPVDDALHIALAVAHALQYAHDHGVVHRDIKPENILLQAGQPIVADFGIALAVTRAGGTRLTQTGLSLGTAQYMSPEQATAERAIDGRSDIYSLATVMYEMLTGEPPHAGSTAQAVIARVLTEKSRSVRVTRANVPPYMDAAIARALEKLPADRFASADEFAAALQGHGAAAPVHHAAANSARASLWRWTLAAAAFAAGAVLGALVMRSRAASSEATGSDAPTVRGSIALPGDAPLALANLPPVGFNGAQITIARDGSTLAYIATTASGNMVYVHDAATGDTRALAGTEGAKVATFSPDGAWIAFVTEDHVKKIPSAGGSVIELCAASTVRAWWPVPGFIYYDSENGLLSRVSAEGGTPERLVSASELGANDFSDVLPGGRMALLNAGNASIGRDHGDVVFADLDTRRKTVLVHSGYAARYVPDGHLIFARSGALFGVRFDPRGAAVSGDPVAIASGVSMESAFGMLQASASRSVLAYVPGVDVSRGKLAWVDRQGRVAFIDAPELVYGEVDLSPDDRHVAVHVADVQDYLWVWDLERHEGVRVNYPEAEGFPRWSADGRRLAGLVLGKQRVALHDVDAAGHVGDGTMLPGAAVSTDYFSPSGDVLAVEQSITPFRTGFVNVRGGAPTSSPVDGALVTFSPDGKWIAYTRPVRGVPEIFIRAFPDGHDIGPVSQGIEPRWKPSGVLYYRSGHRWYETKVTTGPEPRWDRPRLIFDVEFTDTQGWSYDVSRDGQRLLVVKRDRPIESSRIELITNWTKLLDTRR